VISGPFAVGGEILGVERAVFLRESRFKRVLTVGFVVSGATWGVRSSWVDVAMVVAWRWKGQASVATSHHEASKERQLTGRGQATDTAFMDVGVYPNIRKKIIQNIRAI
jgi:hypothetical protein